MLSSTIKFVSSGWDCADKRVVVPETYQKGVVHYPQRAVLRTSQLHGFRQRASKIALKATGVQALNNSMQLSGVSTPLK